ncbi:DUF1772 domain-containing protein [Streptomyces lycii]|uniref:DUF1772 domain-containing protein n=1 Tax=Streptomyces lycii TaxID=2654337 RepID=A0ABQ7FBU9_9ACTN|nr:DUF1772 domain-containing protein [Streptomyces lycii]
MINGFRPCRPCSVSQCPPSALPHRPAHRQRRRTPLRQLATVALLLGTLTTGLMAGLFAAFSYAIMPGLHRGDHRTFVAAMQQINRAILNPWFMSCFMGAIVALGAATALHWSGDRRVALPFVIASLALYLLVFLVTVAVNVPLNEQLDAAELPAGGDGAGLAAVRERFESSWVFWNLVRAVACIASFGCSAWALVLHGRAGT